MCRLPNFTSSSTFFIPTARQSWLALCRKLTYVFVRKQKEWISLNFKFFLLCLAPLRSLSQLHFQFDALVLRGHLLSCWPSCAAVMPIRMKRTNLVEPPAVQQGGQLVQTGLGGVEHMLDAHQVSLWRGQCTQSLENPPNAAPQIIWLPLLSRIAVVARCLWYLGCGEQRHGKLQETLDLDLHGGQGPLEDGQRLQTRERRED